jgi:hypothetical protein
LGSIRRCWDDAFLGDGWRAYQAFSSIWNRIIPPPRHSRRANARHLADFLEQHRQRCAGEKNAPTLDGIGGAITLASRETAPDAAPDDLSYKNEATVSISPYLSMTSSASEISFGATVAKSSLSSLAAFRLITRLYLVGCCTGKLSAFSPRRIRPLYRPIRW